MNNFLVSFFVSAAFLVVSSTAAPPADKTALREKTKELFNACKTKVKASDADMAVLQSHKMPETHAGLCVLECVFDTTKMMKDGKYNKSGFVEGFRPLVGDNDAKMKNVQELASTCEKEIGDGDKDKCQTAKLLAECIMKNGSAHGLNIPTSS